MVSTPLEAAATSRVRTEHGTCSTMPHGQETSVAVSAIDASMGEIACVGEGEGHHGGVRSVGPLSEKSRAANRAAAAKQVDRERSARWDAAMERQHRHEVSEAKRIQKVCADRVARIRAEQAPRVQARLDAEAQLSPEERAELGAKRWMDRRDYRWQRAGRKVPARES